MQKALWNYIAELSYFIWSVANALKVQKTIHYLFSTQSYCIFVQSSIKSVSLSPCDIILCHSKNYHKTFLSLVINKNECAQQPWQFLSSLAKKRQINFNDLKYQLKGELFQVPVMQILIIINNWILILTYMPGVGSKV